MGRRSPLSITKVKEALTNAQGVIVNAAIELKRTRQTVSSFIKKNKLEDFLESLIDVNKDRCRATLLDMALGNLIVEKVTKDGDVVPYNPGPHFPALKLQLEIYGIYVPTLNQKHDVKMDIFTEMSREDDKG